MELDTPKAKAAKRQAAMQWIMGKVEEYERRSAQAKRKARKVRRAHVDLEKKWSMYAHMEKEYKQTQGELAAQLSDSNDLLSAFRRSISLKKNRFKIQYEALMELESSIQGKISEVDSKIVQLEEALLEWHAANCIISDHCKTADYYAIDKFHVWHQTVPLLHMWLAHEAKVHSLIYATARLEGICEEIQAQEEFKRQLQEFADIHFKDVSQSLRLPPLKQINEQRQIRSEAFDQFHWRLVKLLRVHVRSCDQLEREIVAKEQMRARLNTIAMELANRVTDDYIGGLNCCEDESRRQLAQVLEAFKHVSPEEHKSITQELLDKLRASAKSELDNDILELAASSLVKDNAEVGGSFGRLGMEGSLVSSLSGSMEPSLLIKDPSSPLQGSYYRPQSEAKNEASSALSTIKRFFDDVKANIRANKSREYVKTALREVARIANRFDRSIRPTYLRVLEEQRRLLEEGMRDSEDGGSFGVQAAHPGSAGAAPGSAGGEEPKEMVHILNSITATKQLQYTCAYSTHQSIAMLHRLLKEFQLSEEASAAGGGLGTFQLMAERDQRLSSLELISKVAAAFAKTSETLEDWVFEGEVKRYKNAKTKLDSELSKLNLLPDNLALMELSSKFGKKGRAETELEADDGVVPADLLRFNSLQRSPELLQLQQDVDDIQTENSVHEILSISDQLLSIMKEGLPRSALGQQQQQGEAGGGSADVSREKAHAVPLYSMLDDFAEHSGPNVADQEGNFFLGKADIIIMADLFNLSLFWNAGKSEALIVARNIVTRTSHREFRLTLHIDKIGILIGLQSELAETYLLNDTGKAFQQISHHLQIETVETRHYLELVARLNPAKTSYPTTVPDIETYLPSAAPSRAATAPAGSVNPRSELPYGYLLNVMTVRGPSGGLLQHSFPIMHVSK